MKYPFFDGYGQNEILGLKIYKLETTKGGSVEFAEGHITIKNQIKERDIVFKYYNNLLAINLDEFQFKQADIDILTERLKTIATNMRIAPTPTEKDHALANLIILALGVCAGIGIHIMIGG